MHTARQPNLESDHCCSVYAILAAERRAEWVCPIYMYVCAQASQAYIHRPPFKAVLRAFLEFLSHSQRSVGTD